jgi:hypothetical protein
MTTAELSTADILSRLVMIAVCGALVGAAIICGAIVLLRCWAMRSLSREAAGQSAALADRPRVVARGKVLARSTFRAPLSGDEVVGVAVELSAIGEPYRGQPERAARLNDFMLEGEDGLFIVRGRPPHGAHVQPRIVAADPPAAVRIHTPPSALYALVEEAGLDATDLFSLPQLDATETLLRPGDLVSVEGLAGEPEVDPTGRAGGYRQLERVPVVIGGVRGLTILIKRGG